MLEAVNNFKDKIPALKELESKRREGERGGDSLLQMLDRICFVIVLNHHKKLHNKLFFYEYIFHKLFSIIKKYIESIKRKSPKVLNPKFPL